MLITIKSERNHIEIETDQGKIISYPGSSKTRYYFLGIPVFTRIEKINDAIGGIDKNRPQLKDFLKF